MYWLTDALFSLIHWLTNSLMQTNRLMHWYDDSLCQWLPWWWFTLHWFTSSHMQCLTVFFSFVFRTVIRLYLQKRETKCVSFISASSFTHSLFVPVNFSNSVVPVSLCVSDGVGAVFEHSVGEFSAAAAWCSGEEQEAEWRTERAESTINRGSRWQQGTHTLYSAHPVITPAHSHSYYFIMNLTLIQI